MMRRQAPVPFWQREYFPTGYKIAFLQAIELRLQAGESIGRALSAVIQAEPNPNKQRDMRPALEALDHGDTVATAMSRLGFFDSTSLAILRAGERSGMREAMAAAGAHLGVRHAWFRQHALVIAILLNELLSALFAPVILYRDVLPWIREHITPPSRPDLVQAFERDMATAEHLTLGLIGLTVLFLVLAAINLYRIRRLQAPTRVLMFFADGSMGVGFRLASAMLKAGVTIESVARDLARQAPGWAKHFWASVSRQLEQAVHPAQALLQPGLHLSERSLLASHANARQLAEILAVLAVDRELRAKRGRDLLLLVGGMLTVAYIFLCLGLAVWVYLTYDNTLTSALESFGKDL